MKIESSIDVWNKEKLPQTTSKIVTIYGLLFLLNGGIAIWNNQTGNLIISVIGLTLTFLIDKSYVKWNKQKKVGQKE